MSKSRTAPDYLTPKQVLELNDHELLNAFEAMIAAWTNAQNMNSRIPQKLTKQVERLRDEILSRMK